MTAKVTKGVKIDVKTTRDVRLGWVIMHKASDSAILASNKSVLGE